MAATSRLRELNKRGTIAHNIANLFCRYLIFYDQVRYTACFFYVEIFFIFFIIEVISCSSISACLFLKYFLCWNITACICFRKLSASSNICAFTFMRDTGYGTIIRINERPPALSIILPSTILFLRYHYSVQKSYGIQC